MELEGIAAERNFALGLGLTNKCNLACSFCYRDPSGTDRISLEQVHRILATLPVRSVNLGTGGNGMHPDFHPIIGWLKNQPLRMTMTSNGHSVELLTDEELVSSVISSSHWTTTTALNKMVKGERGIEI